MKKLHQRALSFGLCLGLIWSGEATVRGEAMLELFQVNWAQLTQKMPEIAEAGYDSLWLPNPAKGSSVFSVGYDQYDPFDLGDQNQEGTVATKYGTKAQLIQMVQTAHRFGIRVYFDNVMNHRGFTVPGFNASTPTNYYPGLVPMDFHLQTLSGGYFANWPSVQDYNNQWDVQNESLGGLIDLATEPGSINDNFGSSLGGTVTKPVFIRQPGHPEYYMDPTLPSIGGPWHPFNGSHGVPVAEDVNSYLIRAVMYTMDQTKCDGFRMDAVKHVPSGFFGDSFTSWNGYTGAIQAMYDWVHGYGSNTTGNGYVEADDSRNSCFDTEAARNDAMLFGEHLGQPPTFSEYIARGMRLLNAPLRDNLNNALGGGASLSKLDQRDYAPYSGAFSQAQGVQFAQSQDASGCCATHRELQNAYYFMHEGIGVIYSDGFNNAGPPSSSTTFPIVPFANYLGEFGDNLMPDISYVHNQLARGGTWPRWSDQNIVAFERYDNREGNISNPQDQDVVLFVLNDKSGFPADIAFDDGVTRASDGYYGAQGVSNSRGQGLVVGFPPGSVLAQLSSSAPSGNRAYARLLVHGATANYSDAVNTANDPTPANRLIYVGNQMLAQNGGAIELTVPSESWVMYGYQWPEASRASLKDAITLRQGGADAPRITVLRRDGVNGDSQFNPLYPYKMRGSFDQFGNVITGTNYSNLTYSIDIPVVTNGAFDIVVRNDASSVNTLVELDGGVDINSQMGLGPLSNQPGIAPTNIVDLRDNKPGYADDVFLGYEQTAFQFRNGPEKFAARNILSNNVVSLGAETYRYVVGGTNTVVSGAGDGANITNQTAAWVYHDPTNTVTAQGTVPPTQRSPASPGAGQSADVWVKVGYQFQINTCFIYYTTDGSNPEGSFGTGKGTTQVIQAFFANHDSGQTNIDWWKGTIPGQNNGVEVRYKVALFLGGSVYSGQSIQQISDAETSGSKLYGLTQFAITNFNPTTALIWLHNDLNTNNTVTGLQEGFHVVRARTFLPRTNKSSVYNTFIQTFYYDAQTPTGAVVLPGADGTTITNATYTVVVRTDTTTTGVEYNIQDGSANNDDAVTHLPNGNGNTNGQPVFVAVPQAASTTPSLDQQYPNLPQEYRFNYVAVPSNGVATITLHLKKLTTSIYANRYTTITRTINTAAPAAVLNVSSPSYSGQAVVLNPGDAFPIMACFTGSLDVNNINEFSIYINGVLQPRRAADFTPLYSISALGASPCGYPLRTLSCNWTNAGPGTYNIEVDFAGSVTLSATSTLNVTSFHISSLVPNASGNLIVWDSLSNLNYQVWATTNLNVPMEPISAIIPANSSSSFFFDPAPDPTNEFYRVQVAP